MLFLPVYHLDFQLKSVSYLRLKFFTSEIFEENEIDIISQFIELKDLDFQGCTFDFTPRYIKINYTNQQWLQFINPYRPGTAQYINFLSDISNTSLFSSYEIIPEKTPWRYLTARIK